MKYLHYVSVLSDNFFKSTILGKLISSLWKCVYIEIYKYMYVDVCHWDICLQQTGVQIHMHTIHTYTLHVPPHLQPHPVPASLCFEVQFVAG